MSEEGESLRLEPRRNDTATEEVLVVSEDEASAFLRRRTRGEAGSSGPMRAAASPSSSNDAGSMMGRNDATSFMTMQLHHLVPGDSRAQLALRL